MYYAPRIFGLAGFATHEQQLWCTVIVGLVNVLATFGAIALVDRWGRKPILYVGCATMAMGMGTLGWLLHAGIAGGASQVLAVSMLLVFIAGFAMSAGPLWDRDIDFRQLGCKYDRGRDVPQPPFQHR
jgi:SP family galactose:H+ symporter-like MFS transporter